MKTHSRVVAFVSLGVLGLASAANGQQPMPEQHEHAHAGNAALVAKLERNAGKPWPTDASLRSGMAGIRTAFDADHPAIHAGTETDAQYEALAGRIEQHVNDIVAHCKLPPAADAQLHYVVGDLLQGVSLMRGSDSQRSRHDGAALVHGALVGYGKYFDDPSWKKDEAASQHAEH
jgi:hypothetical protein